MENDGVCKGFMKNYIINFFLEFINIIANVVLINRLINNNILSSNKKAAMIMILLLGVILTIIYEVLKYRDIYDEGRYPNDYLIMGKDIILYLAASLPIIYILYLIFVICSYKEIVGFDGFFFYIILYRMYDFTNDSGLIPVKHSIYLYIYILAILAFIVIDNELYGLIITIVSFLIGLVDEDTLSKWLDEDFKDTNFDSKRFIKDKFQIIKLLLIMFPTLGISSLLFNSDSRFNDFFEISYPLDNIADVIFLLCARFVIYYILYIFFAIIFKKDKLINYINERYKD